MENGGCIRRITGRSIAFVVALTFILPVSMAITADEPAEIQAAQNSPQKNFYEENTIIRLAAAQYDINEGPRDISESMQIESYDSRVEGHYIVQFDGPVKEFWKAKLQELDAKLGSYVPYNAFVAKMSAEVKDNVENLDFVQYVGIYQPAYKIPKHLINDITLRNDLQVADSLDYMRYENLWQRSQIIGEGEKTAVSIIVHEGENPYNVAALILKSGGNVLDISETGNTVRAEVSTQGLQILTYLNEVESITSYQIPVPFLATANVWEQNKVAGQTPVWDAGIHGEGIIVANADTGLDTDHEMFRDPLLPIPFGYTPGHRKVIRYEQWADDSIDDSASQHGTHTSGTICGNGDAVGSSDPDRFGMAYEAKISFHDVGASDGTLSGVPTDIKEMYQIQYDDGTSVSLIPWGVGVGWTGPRTLAEGTYNENALNSDWFMWDNKDFQLFFGAGGDRSAGPLDRPDLYPYVCTICPPATAKNGICVAAHQSGSNWQTTESYSSFGPTLGQSYDPSIPAEYFAATTNGRLKPDISSDGNIRSAHGDRNRDGNEDNVYIAMSGTSSSAAAATGGGALVAQYYKDGYWPVTASSPVMANGFTPSAALIKASMINGARDATSGSNSNVHDYELNGHTMDYPNCDQGWGMTDLGDSLYFDGEQGSREMEIDDNQVGMITDQYREYEFYVQDSSDPLEITLVWTDYKGSIAAVGNLVNDLDLTVTSPGGIDTYYGNNYGSSSRESDPSLPAGYDHINNVECALITSPMVGMWTINVSAVNIPVGPQPYALVLTGDFGDNYGWVKMDKHVYKEGDTVQIEVKDIDEVGSVTATLISSTGDTETVTLTEAFPNARRFVGTITTEIADYVQEDGFISIENGGTLTVWYNETTPSHSSKAIASTDVTSPMISNVHVTDISNTAVIVHWTTDVPASSKIYYGQTTALGSTTPYDGDMVYEHAVPVSGLIGFTNYFYDVESVSIGGVTTKDDLGGEHYMFTTIGNPDVLIVQEHSDMESSERHVNDWKLSLDYYGWTYAVWETVKFGLPSVADMNTAKAVLWDVGEGYPQLGSDERAIIQTWLEQAGQQKWFVTGQDIAWDMSDDGLDGPGTDVNNIWRQNYLRCDYVRDDADGGGGNEPGVPFQIIGTTHPISDGLGPYDLEQDVYGTGRFWPDALINNRGGDSPGPWEYSTGYAAAIAYNVSNYKMVYEAFAHCMIQEDGTSGTPGHVFGQDVDHDRAEILDRSLIWLFGEDHPDVNITSPNGGETFNGIETIQWTVANAISIDVQISRDGGQSYVVEATGLPGGTTSYVWDTTTSGTYGPGLDFPNGDYYRVKVIGYGANLKGFDISDANFSVINGGGDDEGPVIWAGSVKPSPIPVYIGQNLHITAIADDRYRGRSTIDMVELYIDGTTVGDKIGNMFPSDFSFDEPLESAEYDHTAFETMGVHTIYVRARDAYNNWGGFESTEYHVVGGCSPPTIDIISPNGGETLMGGSSQIITWDMFDLQDPDANLDVELYYSTTGAGGPWTYIDNADGVETYDWNPVALEDSTNCYIRAVVTDTGAGTDEDISDGPFTIDSTAPAPAANVHADFTGANNVEITWDPSPSADLDHYEVWYRANLGWHPAGDGYLLRADVGLATNYVHVNAGVNTGADYWWQVRTFDMAGHEVRTVQQAAKMGSVQNSLVSNWHLCGSGLVQSDTSLAHVLQGFGLPDNYQCVRTYDSLTNTWKTKVKNCPADDLTQITDAEGFWLYITATTRFAAAGHIEDKVIDLYFGAGGWNLVAYPFATGSMTAADIHAHLQIHCPGYAGKMLIADSGAPYQLIVPTGSEVIQNSHGLWVQVIADTTWTVTNY